MTQREQGEQREQGWWQPFARAIIERAAWFVPAVVAVIAIVPAVRALRAQTFAIFGRDQGIFQYVAWALRNGDRAYKDIHEINGPLPHAWHVLMQSIGGEDEHVFRSIDTAMLVLAYTLAATTIPRWIGLEPSTKRETRWGVHAAWALAGLAVLGAQYTRYDWWHTTQREAFYSVLVLTSLGLQSIGHTTRTRRTALVAFGLASILTTLTWFGKPPCAVFSVLQVVVLVVDRRNVAVSLRAIAGVAVTSGFVVAGSMLAFVLAYGDLGLGLELLSKVPRLHHTIWNETLIGAYHAYNNRPRLDWAMLSFAGFIAAFVLLKLPRRALLAGVLPAGGFLVFAGQGKAFPYHLHMLTLGTAVAQLVILGALVRHVQSASVNPRWRDAIVFATVLAALGLGAKSAQDAWLAPSIRGKWASAGATPERRAGRAYFDRFPWGDFFANDLRDGAAYLAFHTRPDERVQTYGFDPYLLFLARRKSASPVIYNFELNVDAALEGGPGARPSAELRTWLLAYRDDAERLVLASVEASPPAAFALLDHAPFTHPADAELDFAVHCPALFRWMTARYAPAATFGTVRIWLRQDVMARRTAL